MDHDFLPEVEPRIWSSLRQMPPRHMPCTLVEVHYAVCSASPAALSSSKPKLAPNSSNNSVVSFRIAAKACCSVHACSAVSSSFEVSSLLIPGRGRSILYPINVCTPRMRRNVARMRAGDLILVVFASTSPPKLTLLDLPGPIKGDDVGRNAEGEAGPKCTIFGRPGGLS